MQENIKGLYAAFKAKDARFDGRFFVGISSTGIYCRPVCKARQPKAENCTFQDGRRCGTGRLQALPFVQAGTCSRDLCY
nr:Ada metal-binding domain-containing protein [Phascolarctobacterium sp.]